MAPLSFEGAGKGDEIQFGDLLLHPLFREGGHGISHHFKGSLQLKEFENMTKKTPVFTGRVGPHCKKNASD